jgi:hypothetical protein
MIVLTIINWGRINKKDEKAHNTAKNEVQKAHNWQAERSFIYQLR